MIPLPIPGPWLLLAGLLAVACAGLGGYVKGHRDAALAAEVETLRQSNAALAAQQKLQERVNDITLQAQRDRRAISLQRDAALERLRNRPADRLPEPARAACAGSTGAELSRPDAGFLVRLAAEADDLRADLKACRAWIDAVRRR